MLPVPSDWEQGARALASVARAWLRYPPGIASNRSATEFTQYRCPVGADSASGSVYAESAVLAF